MANPIPFYEVQQQEFEHLGLTGVRATGLCLSGGGIRSATFALGVLQGLAKKKLLSEFDYLSTVSGGGYIGAWFTAWVRNRDTDTVLRGLAQENEPVPIQHLRQYSNYLSPRLGLFSADTWTLAATLLRNLFLNWLILLPMLIAAVLLPRLAVSLLVPPRSEQAAWIALTAACLMGVFSVSRMVAWVPRIRHDRGGYSEFSFVLQHAIPLVLSAFLFGLAWYWLDAAFAEAPLPFNPRWMLGLLGAVVNSLGWGIGLAQVRPKMTPAQWAGIALVAVGLGFVAGWGLYAVGSTKLAKLLLGDPLLFTTATPPLVIGMLMVAAFLFVGLGSYREFIEDRDREWWARSAAWLLILAAGWAGFCGIALFGPRLLMLAGEGIGAAYTAAGGTLSGVVAAWIGWSPPTFSGQMAKPGEKGSAWAATVTHLAEKLFAPIFAVTLVAGVSLAVSIADGSAVNWNAHEAALRTASPWILAVWTGGLFGSGYLIGWLFSVNRFSLNAMYRNRLIRAYLGASRPERKPNPLTGFDTNDNLLMSSLSNVERPLHILNLALNVTSGEELAWQQRKAASFTVSCLHSGFGDRYQPSASYTDAGGISLGTAVSVSGAAASPNMGYHSSRALTFIMALFNARLGAWLPNPAMSNERVLTSGGPDSPLVLLWEMLGLTSASGNWVYLSDGGHFENLGLYEMARRRCELIVVSDAGADPKYEYEDLANAVQKIRVDLGASIEFVVRPPMHNKRDTPGSHAALLEIRYADGSKGKILYLKPAFSGNEATRSPDVYKYAGENPDFPHQSTADQFFDETQFESYRRLGEQSIEAITEGWDRDSGFPGLFDHVQGMGGALGAAGGR